MRSSRAVLFTCVATMGSLALAAGAQPAQPSAPAQTKNHEGLEITLVSFTTASSGSIGGACPPRMAGFVQGTMKRDRVLADVKVKVRVLPTYKGATVAKVTLEDDQAQAHDTLTTLEDFGNPSGEREYECVFKFVVPKAPVYRKLRVDSASFDLPSPRK